MRKSYHGMFLIAVLAILVFPGCSGASKNARLDTWCESLSGAACKDADHASVKDAAMEMVKGKQAKARAVRDKDINEEIAQRIRNDNKDKTTTFFAISAATRLIGVTQLIPLLK